MTDKDRLLFIKGVNNILRSLTILSASVNMLQCTIAEATEEEVKDIVRSRGLELASLLLDESEAYNESNYRTQ